MIDSGFPHEPDVTSPNNTMVFSFPIAAPEDAITRDDITAIEHMEIWKKFQAEWCDHNPSITVNVAENDWPAVGAWVWENFDIISGMTFLPYDGGEYRQAPYEAVDEIVYNDLLAEMPENIDWSTLSDYEHEDHTTGVQTLACSGDACEVVDIT
jgi:ribonucleoside-diphosphate reductase alpha chain